MFEGIKVKLGIGVGKCKHDVLVASGHTRGLYECADGCDEEFELIPA